MDEELARRLDALSPEERRALFEGWREFLQDEQSDNGGPAALTDIGLSRDDAVLERTVLTLYEAVAGPGGLKQLRRIRAVESPAVYVAILRELKAALEAYRGMRS